MDKEKEVLNSFFGFQTWEDVAEFLLTGALVIIALVTVVALIALFIVAAVTALFFGLQRLGVL